MSTLLKVTELDNHFILAMDDGKANALSFDMLDALNAGLDQAAAAEKVVGPRKRSFKVHLSRVCPRTKPELQYASQILVAFTAYAEH